MKFQKGFTLIELLVVVAIISLLSSVVLASIGEARERARVSKFKQELNQFVNAVELYRSDNGGNLPGYVDGSTGSFYLYNGSASGSLGSNDESGSAFHNDLLAYIPSIPIPLSESWYYYVDPYYRCSGEEDTYDYLILVHSSNPGFEEWSDYQTLDGGEWIDWTDYKCRSF